MVNNAVLGDIGNILENLGHGGFGFDLISVRIVRDSAKIISEFRISLLSPFSDGEFPASVLRKHFLCSVHLDVVTIRVNVDPEVLELSDKVVARPFASRLKVVTDEYANVRLCREAVLLVSRFGLCHEIDTGAERDSDSAEELGVSFEVR